METNKYYEISTNRMRVLRIIGSLVDFILVSLFSFMMYFVLKNSLIISLLFTSLVSIFYFTICDLLFYGKTLGNAIAKTKVVYIKQTWWAKIIRNLIISINFLPYINIAFWFINLTIALIKPTMMLHDYIVKSLVVYKYSNYASSN